jgi:hypothetical protein
MYALSSKSVCNKMFLVKVNEHDDGDDDDANSQTAL